MSRDIYKGLGICIVCEKEKVEPNKTSCWKCLERDRKNKIQYRKNDTYNKKHNDYRRELYAKRKENGLCTRCGKKATIYTKCLECYTKNRKYRKTRKDNIVRAERVSYGMCYFCGNDILPGKRVCSECYKRLLVCTQKMNDAVRVQREMERNAREERELEKLLSRM